MSGGLHFLCIDTECTGLSSQHHEITQISVIRCADRVQFSRYIKAEFPEKASPEALKVTGRTYKDLLIGDSKEKTINDFETFINKDGATPEARVMIAHNASFDKRFLHALWDKVNKTFPAVCWLDSKTLAKRLANKLGIEKPKLTLQASMETAGLKMNKEYHNAIADAQAVYMLFDHYKKQGIDFLEHIKRHPHE